MFRKIIRKCPLTSLVLTTAAGIAAGASVTSYLQEPVWATLFTLSGDEEKDLVIENKLGLQSYLIGVDGWFVQREAYMDAVERYLQSVEEQPTPKDLEKKRDILSATDPAGPGEVQGPRKYFMQNLERYILETHNITPQSPDSP